MQSDGGFARRTECLQDDCAWWYYPEGRCALPALAKKLDHLVDKLDGFDGQGLNVRVRSY